MRVFIHVQHITSKKLKLTVSNFEHIWTGCVNRVPVIFKVVVIIM